MNKISFKHKLKAFISRIERLNALELDEERVLSVLLGTAMSLPTLNIEPFFSKLYNLFEDSFATPETKHQELRDTAVELLCTQGTFNVNFNVLRLAGRNALARMQLKPHMFRPATAYEAVHSLPTETSSGFPRFHRPKREQIPEVYSQMAHIIMTGSFYVINEVMVTYVSWRTQERQSGTKFRQFFIFPMLINAFEMMFMLPILNYYKDIGFTKHCSYSYHGSFQEQKMIWKECQRYRNTVGIDYSAFDLHVPQRLIFYAFILVKGLFKLNWWQSKIFDCIIQCHINSRVVTNYKGQPVIIIKRSGILSGSVFTNFIDTLINAIMIEYAFQVNSIDTRNKFFKFKGDDTIIASNDTQLWLNTVVKTLVDSFGAEIKPEAIQVFSPGEAIFYLGYWFTDRTRLASSTDLLKRKMVVSGRFFDEGTMPAHIRVISKAVSILSNVSNGYELFYELGIEERFKQVYPDTPLPRYYYDLTERNPDQYMKLKDVQYDLRFGWQYK